MHNPAFKQMPLKLLLISPKAKQFSGQSEAFRLLAKCLSNTRIHTTEVLTPSFDRNSNSYKSQIVSYLVQLLTTWLRAMISKDRHDYTVGTIGQTWAGLLRDGATILIYSAINRSKMAIALHGNLFASWSKYSAISIAFTTLLNQCDVVTVLGRQQSKTLEELGVKKHKIRIIPNTCSIQPVSPNEIINKFQTPHPVRILYLSSLIAAKGFPEFVESIEILSKLKTRKIQATLCGPLTPSPFDNRFSSAIEAKKWIQSKSSAINKSNSTTLQWINGAQGSSKSALFSETHIFVLPSRYKVEAQPIVLIEAMASGCDIITSQAGEIPSTAHKLAICLKSPSSENLAEAIKTRINNLEKSRDSAHLGLHVYNNRFSNHAHTANWIAVINRSTLTERAI